MLRRVLLLCVLSAAVGAGCGGGGGGDNNEPAFPTSGRYALAGGPLTVGFTPEARAAALTITASNVDLEGTYDMGDTTALTVSAGKGVRLDSSDHFPAMQVTVTTPFSFPTGSQAVAGALTIQMTDGKVDLSVNPSGTGVTIKETSTAAAARGIVFGDGEATLTWEQFFDMDVLGDAPLYQRIAQLGYNTLTFTLEQSAFHARSIQVMQQKEPDLTAKGSGKSLDIPGYAFPGMAAGKYALTWTDSPTVPPIGECGPGDNFTMGMDNYWVKYGSESGGPMYTSGTLSLTNYITGSSPVKYGFGGVSYDHLILREVIQESPGVFSLGSTISVNGNLAVTFIGD